MILEDKSKLETIHISTSLSSKTIIQLMDDYPNLKKVTCPQSIYNRIPQQYLEALEELEIAVEIGYNWGNPKYNEKDHVKVIDMINKGCSPDEISKKLNLSIKSVYYLKDKDEKKKITLKRGKKRKYDEFIRERIKKSANDGVSPKEISQKENIPLRTIYYILKKG